MINIQMNFKVIGWNGVAWINLAQDVSDGLF
jgi:hypothetical protein